MISRLTASVASIALIEPCVPPSATSVAAPARTTSSCIRAVSIFCPAVGDTGMLPKMSRPFSLRPLALYSNGPTIGSPSALSALTPLLSRPLMSYPERL